MVYTVTLSPAVDYVVELDVLKLGEINRTNKEHPYPGGKGINVSLMLSNLGRSSVATGFTAGFTGEYIKSELEKKYISSRFIEVEGLTRINFKIRSDSTETAINGQGPVVNDREIEELIRRLEVINENDVLVISGAIPVGIPDNIYDLILSRIYDNNPLIVIDARKDILLSTLRYRPLLIKPNLEELEEIFNEKLTNHEQIIEKAQMLVNKGARNVIVSLGGDGAILVSKNVEPVYQKTIARKAVNTVGCGDSMIAGFIDEYLESRDTLKAFKQAVAAGTASAGNEKLANKAEVLDILEKI